MGRFTSLLILVTKGACARHAVGLLVLSIAVGMAALLMPFASQAREDNEAVTAQESVPPTSTPTSAPSPTPTPTPIPPTPTLTPVPPTPTPTPIPPTPTPIPPTPTSVPPTPTPAPEETPTPEPTNTPTPEPTPTQAPNTDSMTSNTSTAPVNLVQGQEHTYTFTYTVTTPRAGTAISAELRTAEGALANGWIVRAQAGQGGWAGNGAKADLTESVTRTPGAFTLTIIVQAPVNVAGEQVISLYLGSTVTTDDGEAETAIGLAPVASLGVVALTPSPVPTMTDLFEPRSGTGEVQSLVIEPSDPKQDDPITSGSDDSGAPQSTTDTTPEPGAQPANLATPSPDATPRLDEQVSDVAPVATPKPGTQNADDAPAATPPTDATPQVTPDQADVPGNDGELACSAASSVSVEAGEPATFHCDATGYEDVQLRVANASYGWTFDFSLNPGVSDEPRESDVSRSGGFQDVTIALQPEDDAAHVAPRGRVTVDVIQHDAGDGGTSVIESTVLAANLEEPDGALQASKAAPEGSCTSSMNGPVTTGDVVEFTCSYTTGPVKAFVTGITDGWEYSFTGKDDSFTDTRSNSPATGNGDGTLNIFLRATEKAEPGKGEVSVEIRANPYKDDSLKYRTSLSATLEETPACEPTVGASALNFGSATWDGNGYQTVNGTLQLAISTSGEDCSGMPAGWNIQVGTLGLAGPGGTAIPPNNIAYVGTNGNPPSGITPRGNVSLSENLQTIATTNTTEFDESGWNATFELTPPDDAPPGAYSGTITISVANGQ